MGQIWITICAVLLTGTLAIFILACAFYWLAQAVAVLRGAYIVSKEAGAIDDDEGTDGADFWKRGGRK